MAIKIFERKDPKDKSVNELFKNIENWDYYFEASGEEDEPLFYNLAQDEDWVELKRRFDTSFISRSDEMLTTFEMILDLSVATAKQVVGKVGSEKVDELVIEILKKLKKVYGVD